MLSSLLTEIEVAATPRVTANTRNVLPVAVVTANVVVDQMLLKESAPKRQSPLSSLIKQLAAI